MLPLKLYKNLIKGDKFDNNTLILIKNYTFNMKERLIKCLK